MLNETDDILPDDITLKNVLKLITWFIKDDNKFYPQLFSEEALVANIVKVSRGWQKMLKVNRSWYNLVNGGKELVKKFVEGDKN